MELCSRGSLYDILNDQNTHIGWKQVLGFATQMVTGLQTLHNATPQVLHRDIKSMNFLVDKEWTVKGNFLWNFLVVILCFFSL